MGRHGVATPPRASEARPQPEAPSALWAERLHADTSKEGGAGVKRVTGDVVRGLQHWALSCVR